MGILSGKEMGEANKFIDIPIVTGMRDARNVIIPRTAHGVIAVAGSFGTLSEIGFALKFKKPLVGLGTWWLAPSGAPSSTEEGADVPASPWLKADPSVTYVGVKVCRECHPSRHASYKRTPHSRAMRDVVPDEQPLPFELHHKPSRLHYSMFLQDGTLHIRESLDLEDTGERVTLIPHVSTVQRTAGILGHALPTAAPLKNCRGMIACRPSSSSGA